MTLTNTNWMGHPKSLKTEAIDKISSWLTIGDEVSFTVLSDFTKEMAFYEYGPALSLLEFSHFIKQITTKITTFHNYHDELFCQFFNVLSSNQSQDFVLRNTCVMIFKRPICVLVKFGEIQTIKYVIHLDNHCLYRLDNNSPPTPYSKEAGERLKNKYLETKKLMDESVGSQVVRDIASFEYFLIKKNSRK